MTRIFTAIGLVVFAVYLVFFAPQPVFVAGALLMSLLCYWEFGNLAVAQSILRPGLLGVALGIALVLRPQDALLATTLWFLVQLTLGLRRSNLREIAPEAAATIFGAFYCFAPWRYAVDLRAVNPQVLFFALALNWVGDSSAFYAGRLFGKHKLSPTISPGKSWEGAAASVAGSVLFGIMYLHYVLPNGSPASVALLSVAGNIAGQLGDLAESAIKRGAALKDSGKLLPGHGGILDRIDSNLFTLPIVFLLGRLLTLF